MPTNDVNVVALEGNLTKDPIIQMAGDVKVAKFSIAVNRYRSAKAGQSTSYIDIVCFGGKADFVEQYVIKGKRIWVNGELEQDRWEDKSTGEKRSKIVVRAFDVNFGYGPMDDRKAFDFTKEDTHEVTPTRAQRNATPPPQSSGSNEEVPF